MDAVLYTPNARTFPVPNSVGEVARRGLELRSAFPEQEIPAASVDVGAMLAAGGSLTLDIIQLLDDYFTMTSITASGFNIEDALWGGDPARRWADKILAGHQKQITASASSVLDKISYNESHSHIGLLQTDGEGEENRP